MSDIRLLTGALVTLVTLSVTAFQLLGEKVETAEPARGEASRLELRIVEKMPPVQQAAIPRKWVAPPSELAIEWLAFLDTVNDTKMDPAAPGAEAARAPAFASVNIDADTEMDSAPIDLTAGNRRTLAIFSAERTGMEFAGPPAAAKVAVAMGARLEADPQTTGSLGPPNSLRPTQPVQARVAPPAPARPAIRQAAYRADARPTEPAEAQRETLPSPLAFLFPLGGGAAAPNGQKYYPPLDRTAIGVLAPCCRRGD